MYTINTKSFAQKNPKKKKKKSIQPLKTRGLCATNNLCKQDKMQVSVAYMYPLFRVDPLSGMSDNLSDCPTRGWHELGRKRPQCTGQQFVHERLLAQVALGPLRKRNRSRTQAPLTDRASAANREQETRYRFRVSR